MRPPLVRFISTGSGPSMGGGVEGWVYRLLADATHCPAHDSHEALVAIANGMPIEIDPESMMTAWRFITIKNLQALVRAGARHLRRCGECQRWFLTPNAKRRTCYRPTCQKALVAKRQAKARRHEQAEQRRARVTVKGTAGTK